MLILEKLFVMIEGESSKKYHITRRTFILLFLKLLGFIVIGIRLVFLQIFQGEKYNLLSTKNRVRIISIPPSRGIIYDTNGTMLLSNKYNYRVILDKKVSEDYTSSVNKLCDLIGMCDDIRIELLSKVHSYCGLQPITILDYIEWEKITIIEENSQFLSGIYVDYVSSREYFLLHFFHIL